MCIPTSTNLPFTLGGLSRVPGRVTPLTLGGFMVHSAPRPTEDEFASSGRVYSQRREL